MFSWRKLSFIAVLVGLISFFSFTTYAHLTKENYFIIAPQCLIKNVSSNYQTLSTLDQLSFVKIDETGFNQLLENKAHNKELCGGFINVTDAWQEYHYKHIKFLENRNPTSFLQKYRVSTATPQKLQTTYALNHSKEVAQLLATLNPQTMWDNLSTLSSFDDRYSKSDHGVEAANWIKSQVEKMAKDNGRSDVTVYLVNTGKKYIQPSVVAKIGDSNQPGIVIGAHMDTLASFFDKKPGADDDGTGSVTVLETTRTLLSSGMHFKKPIYVIWYAAEEMGLVGSQYVVADFKAKNIPVEEVIHFDMTGYANQNDPAMWLIQDNTNPELTAFLADLINAYVKQPIKYTRCGYACSDHATWNSNGYKAAIAFEAEFGKYDPYIHTPNDKMDVLSLSHMTDFAKLATAFAVELAEPV